MFLATGSKYIHYKKLWTLAAITTYFISNVDTAQHALPEKSRFGQIVEIETSIKAAEPISPDTINANQSCYFCWIRIFETANFSYKSRDGREQ